MIAPHLLRRSEAAQLLRVSPRRIAQLVASGDLAYVLLGKRHLIPHDSVIELIEQRRQRVEVPPDPVTDQSQLTREAVRTIAARRREGAR